MIIDDIGYELVDGKRVGERKEPKVLCVVIAPIKKDFKLDKRCEASWMNQDYQNYSLLIHYEQPLINSEHYLVNLNVNCSHNRNQARLAALNTDADYFLFLDSDIELPATAISSFMMQVGNDRKTTLDWIKQDGTVIPKGTHVPEKHIQGGWYPIIGLKDGRLWGFPCGEFIGDNQYLPFLFPQSSLVRTDICGAGCLFMTRKALSDIKFEHGLNYKIKLATNGADLFCDESGRFGMMAYEKGYDIYMNGDVICKHHKPGRLKKRVVWEFKILQKKLTVMASRFCSRKKSQPLQTLLSIPKIS